MLQIAASLVFCRRVSDEPQYHRASTRPRGFSRPSRKDGSPRSLRLADYLLYSSALRGLPGKDSDVRVGKALSGTTERLVYIGDVLN